MGIEIRQRLNVVIFDSFVANSAKCVTQYIH